MLTQLSIKNIPKVDLHRHLDCSWRYSTLVELAVQMNLVSKNDFKKIEETFLITKPLDNLNAVINKFSNAQKLLKEPEILERLAFEVIEDAYNDNIRILELRYSLNFVSEASGLSYDKIHQSFYSGMKKAVKRYPIAVGLISIFQRGQSSENLKKILDFTLQNKQSFIGADLADNESQFNVEDYRWIFDRLHDNGIPITIHCGETPDQHAAQRIKKSIDLLHAQRIGHGIQLITDPEILNYVKSKNVLLEICPISNVLTQAFCNLKKHPIHDLFQLNVPISINTDDPGVFNTQLSDDYSWLMREFSMTIEQFNIINLLAAKASFIEENLKKEFWPL